MLSSVVVLLGCGAPVPDGSETALGSTTELGTDSTASPLDSSSSETTCVPTSCAEQGKNCGSIPDGCGLELDCGECESPLICGGTRIRNVCGLACDPGSCDGDGVRHCGVIVGNCDIEIDCGDCPAPLTCGGGGIGNVCGMPCTSIVALFFDLEGTLVEPDGTGMLMARAGAAQMLADLQALPVPLGLVINRPRGFDQDDLAATLVEPELLDAFDVVLMSSQSLAPPKPDPAIFLEAHALLATPPGIERVAFITEDLPDIADLQVMPTQGARAAGMFGVHLSNGAPSPLADRTMPLDDLGAIVQITEEEWLACQRRPVDAP